MKIINYEGIHMNKNPIDIAKFAAKEAGKIILRSMGNIQKMQVENKIDFDFVTKIDKNSENKIIELIRSSFPDHSIMAEESGEHDNVSRYTWVIDPLDGTNNYIHGFPFFSVSIALFDRDDIIMGVVYDPIRQELFHAEKGKGSFLNDCAIRVSDIKDPGRSLIGTGFPFKNKDYLGKYMKSFAEVFEHVSGVRRPGSAALDLSYVACGRLDGFWEAKLSPWDISAGILLVIEAGGVVTDFSGGTNYFDSEELLIGNPSIHEFLLNEVKPVLGD